MTAHVVLQNFKMQMISLLDELIDIFPNDGQLYSYRFFISDKIPMQDLMHRFHTSIIPLESEIEDRNEGFFQKVGMIFPDQSDKFLDIWESGKLDIEDKDTIWAYFDVFLELARRYERMRN